MPVASWAGPLHMPRKIARLTGSITILVIRMSVGVISPQKPNLKRKEKANLGTDGPIWDVFGFVTLRRQQNFDGP